MELLEMIKDAGIIGAGGAGFPTHVKLAAKADYILRCRVRTVAAGGPAVDGVLSG